MILCFGSKPLTTMWLHWLCLQKPKLYSLQWCLLVLKIWTFLSFII